MSKTADELETITAKIVALTEERLADGTPYLLSRLGKDLGEDLRILKIESGKPLAGFIEDHLSDRYSIVLAGQHNNVQALVRADDADDHSLPERFGAAPLTEAGERYNFRFWAAFTVPLRGKRRYLNLDDFIFVDGEEAPSGNYIEVNTEYVTPEGIRDRDIATRHNVEQWIERNGFEKERFLGKLRSGKSRDASSKISKSILEVVLETLDHRQLSSTSLSLDVIASLHRRRF